jgi:uncharacterized protein (TIGR00255 family)
MTGLGRGRGSHQGLDVLVEARSVNHKYLDVRIRLPAQLSALEAPAVALARTRMDRGRLDITVSLLSVPSTMQPRLDVPAARGLVEAFSQLGNQLGLAGTVTVSDLVRLHELVLQPPSSADESAAWPAVEAALTGAMADLERMRAQEGEALTRDLLVRLGAVETLATRVKDRLPAALGELQARYRSRVAELVSDATVDPARLAQECALMAERTDVSEEMTRLHSHTAQFRRLLEGREPSGRKLDFLCQELHREANTTASKAQDAQVQAWVVDLKADIERIREQVQNIT